MQYRQIGARHGTELPVQVAHTGHDRQLIGAQQPAGSAAA